MGERGRFASAIGPEDIWAAVIYRLPSSGPPETPIVFYGFQAQSRLTCRPPYTTRPTSQEECGCLAFVDFDTLPSLFVNLSTVAALNF
jgi:hypothetical protein